MRGAVSRFEPGMDAQTRQRRLEGWAKAVEAVLRA